MRDVFSPRKLRLESLEERALLAVMAGGFEQMAFLAAPTEEELWAVNAASESGEGICGFYDAQTVITTVAALNAADKSEKNYESYFDIDVGNLSSKPGSESTIYLDFDGHVTTDSYWTNRYGNRIVTPRFNLDGNAEKTSFTASERAVIYEVWLRVAEDFLPFDVNVTTVEPSVESFAAGRTQRVVIGGSNSDWYATSPSSTTGVSSVGTFANPGDRPNFVFSESIGGEAKSIAETVSHETGHALGLHHDGITENGSRSEYFSGKNDWGPLMGNPVVYGRISGCHEYGRRPSDYIFRNRISG